MVEVKSEFLGYGWQWVVVSVDATVYVTGYDEAVRVCLADGFGYRAGPDVPAFAGADL
jgi:hypothetical protein